MYNFHCRSCSKELFTPRRDKLKGQNLLVKINHFNQNPIEQKAQLYVVVGYVKWWWSGGLNNDIY